MEQKFNRPNREETKALHQTIVNEYAELIDLSNGKNIQKILDKLAKKHGYAGGGQSVRNILNAKKQSEEKENQKKQLV